MNELQIISISVKAVGLLFSATISYYLLKYIIYKDLGDWAISFLILSFLFIATIMVQIWI
ncbi:MAG: hypothetical protein ACP5P2_00350 [Candidatus Micrarchaeia archaeon]|jgi:hypothetical protein